MLAITPSFMARAHRADIEWRMVKDTTLPTFPEAGTYEEVRAFGTVH
jgi:hypothetical protein